MVLEYKICIGLYAYLRQIELSVDRATPSNTEGIRSYFLMPRVYRLNFVAAYFENLIRKDEDFLFVNHSDKNFLPNFLSKKNISIKNKDMLTIVKCLNEANDLMSCNHQNSVEFIKTRIMLNRVSWNFIGSKLSYEDRLQAHSVEHYHQSEYKEFNSIDGILGAKWLK